MREGSSDSDLVRRLRESTESELVELIEEHLEELTPPEVMAVLRNPFASQRIIKTLSGQRKLLISYEVRRALAIHPRTSPARSLNLVGTLFWRDLVKIGADSRAPPRIRRAADQRLAQRLPGLATGERRAIARGCGAGVIACLRHDSDPGVIRDLLENPRLTEGLLLPALTSASTEPKILALISEDRKWGSRYGLRVAIARNPRTPTGTALQLLPLLKKKDLAAVAHNPRIASVVRRRADLLRGALTP